MDMMVTPNVPGMASIMTKNRMQNEIGTAVLSKSLDTMEQSGAAMVKMMERSVNPSVGGNFDMSV